MASDRLHTCYGDQRIPVYALDPDNGYRPLPARVTIHTDTRRRAIQLDKLTIEFKQTAPSRLYWAGRPACVLYRRCTGYKTR
jgi:hypothetical protein